MASSGENSQSPGFNLAGKKCMLTDGCPGMSWTTVSSIECQGPAVGLLWKGSGHAPVVVEASMVVKPKPGFAGLLAQPVGTKEFQEAFSPGHEPFGSLGHPSKRQMSSCLMEMAGFGGLSPLFLFAVKQFVFCCWYWAVRSWGLAACLQRSISWSWSTATRA